MKAVVFDIILGQILTMVTTLYLGLLEPNGVNFGSTLFYSFKAQNQLTRKILLKWLEKLLATLRVLGLIKG